MESLKNNPFIVLISLSIIIASVSAFANLPSITELAIGASICFSIALIFFIINHFKENIWCKSFIFILSVLGLAFFIGFTAIFISYSWFGNIVYYIILAIVFFYLFIYLNSVNFRLYNFLKRQEKRTWLRFFIIPQIGLSIIGISIMNVAFAGWIIIKSIFGELFLHIFFAHLVYWGITVFCYGFLLFAISIMIFRKESKELLIKKPEQKIWKWLGDEY